MGPFEIWARRLRLPWLDTSGKALVGGVAQLLGDRARDWATRARFGTFPQTCDAPALPRVGAASQLGQGRYETTEEYRERLTHRLTQWGLAGSDLGLLLALHIDGWTGPVIAQQNGVVLEVAPPIDWANPWASLVCMDADTLIAPVTSAVDQDREIPAGAPWWLIDLDTDYCSRYEILFPDPPAYFSTSSVATFAASSTATIEWSNAFSDSTYLTAIGAVTGGGIVSVTDQTPTGATLTAVSPFTGTATVQAWQSGAHPLADPHPADLARLRRIIRDWSPAKATCDNICVRVSGSFAGYPPRTWAETVSWVGDIVKFSP